VKRNLESHEENGKRKKMMIMIKEDMIMNI
jgi:hypothetical protein